MKREGFIRNLVFGVEDGLVSTVGFVSGIAISDVAHVTLLLSALVLIFVEAFSMAVGSFLSETSVQEYRSRSRVSSVPSVIGGFVMFLAYLAAGALVISPYFVFSAHQAFKWSIGISLVALFVLGIFSARVSHVRPLKRGIRMAVIGGGAIALGVFVAKWAMNII